MLQLSLKALALDRDLTERLTEEVLRAVSSSVTPVAADGQNESLIFFVVSEKFAEAIRELKEVLILGNLSF